MGLSISSQGKFKRNNILLEQAQSLLFVVDIQERFRKVIPGFAEVVKQSSILHQAANRLNIPVVFSEQYPKALGATVTELLQDKSEESLVFPKMEFSAALAPKVLEHINALHPQQIILCGLETHVCILQTALDFCTNLGCKVYVVVEAVAARKSVDHEMGLKRLAANGVELITTEMVIFEWLKVSGTPDFKALQGLIR